MRFFGKHETKDEARTNRVREQAVSEREDARKQINAQFTALFDLMDETLKTIQTVRLEDTREEGDDKCKK